VLEFARAKLNLYLHVVGRRADGYHLLDSLVAFAEIGDRVSAAPAADLSLKVGGPFAAQLEDDPERNLVLRSARYLAARCNVAQGAALLLEKHLPVASGIGGGSSDAAAALRALAGLWRCDLAKLDPSDIARTLGADVPVCLLNRAAWLGGIGEVIAPAPPLPNCWAVLANPGLALATPAVFRARQGAFSETARFESAIADASNLAELLSERRNDLASAALALAPEIGVVLAALAAEPGALLARMSGSGATCFALFAVRDAAETAAMRLAAAHPSWWVAQGKLG
jgi:4-diphosphocytidyl-2-C-methyl-D-erythritol kinase